MEITPKGKKENWVAFRPPSPEQVGILSAAMPKIEKTVRRITLAIGIIPDISPPSLCVSWRGK